MKMGQTFNFQIGIHNFKVEFKNAEEIAEIISEATDEEVDPTPELLGIIIPQRNLILVRSDIPLSQQEEAFWHEAIHGMNPEMKESDVKIFAILLVQVLKANKII